MNQNNETVNLTEGPLILKEASEWCNQARAMDNPRSLWMGLWHEGELACLFADSNVGKSILAVQIAHEISQSQRVVYYDFELSAKQFQLRYTDGSTGSTFNFNPNLIRCELDSALISDSVCDGSIIDQIVGSAQRAHANVIIIDNLTFMCNDSENGLAAHDLMVRLTELKRQWGLSVLVLAHTPKRDCTQPITQNDLAGSKRLFNFFDAVWSLGKSNKGVGTRYIKQLKARLASIEYDTTSVLECEIVKNPDGYLHFEPGDTSSEYAHLKRNGDSDSRSITDDQRLEVLILHEDGKSMRQIASAVGISVSAVHRIIHQG